VETRQDQYRRFYEQLAQDHGDMDDQYYGPEGTSGGWGDRLLDHVIGQFPVCDGLFADIGCADGRLLAKLAGIMPRQIGIELSCIRLQRARRKMVAYGCRTILAQSFLEAMPIRKGSVAAATCLETLEHVLDARKALTELRRILQPGGHLMVSVPSVTLRTYWEMYRLRRPIYCDEQEHLREFTARPISWFANKFVTTAELERWFVESAFEVRRRSGVGYLFPRWAEVTPMTKSAFQLLYGQVNDLFGYVPYIRRFPKHTVYHLVAV
jgi:SAM-dependent methyltransferase